MRRECLKTTFRRAVLIVTGLMLMCTPLAAQQKVYKWVDKDGVLHLSDEPPPASVKAETQVIQSAPTPPGGPRLRPRRHRPRPPRRPCLRLQKLRS